MGISPDICTFWQIDHTVPIYIQAGDNKSHAMGEGDTYGLTAAEEMGGRSKEQGSSFSRNL